ncbi:MAG: MotA/TolQ/ExbB proton channel family protein, partial [Ignavibacteria bacterium]|nr:MotA/TolQ/ExbB proton channel family protein [Ignavibacteria bacterium]
MIFILQQIENFSRSWLSDNWFLNILNKGGWYIMYPLLFLSIISLGIIIERILKFSAVPNQNKSKQILEEIKNLIHREGKINSIIDWCKNNKSIYSLIYLDIIKRFNFLVDEKRPLDEMRKELALTGEDTAYDYLEEHLPTVDTIASVATLLGLLGTILGMILSFDEIAKGGKGDPAIVAGGISVALITTAGGLIVAIPSVIGFSFLKRRVRKIVNLINPNIIQFVNLIVDKIGKYS